MEECSTSTCDTDITQQIHKIDSFTVSLSKSFQSIKTTANNSSQFQVQLEEAKGKLKEVDDDLVKVLAEKTQKEAKRMALLDAIASAKARVGKLNTSIQVHRSRKQEYTSFLSQQSLALAASQGKFNDGIEHDEIEEAISWYNRVLGFHVKGGRGIKFTFRNINVSNPNEEYTFTVCHDNNTYKLLSCKPPLDGIKELIHELNRTDGLFRFVRILRKKFQEAFAREISVLTTVGPEESAFISPSAPGTSVRSDSTITENDLHHQVELSDGSAHLKEKKYLRRKNLAHLSLDSPSSVRQSPRLKARK